MKKNIKWIVFLISIILFIVIAYMVKTKNDLYIDTLIYKLIEKHITNNLTNYIKYMTYIGSAFIVLGVVLFVFIFFKNKKYSLYMLLNLINITIFQLILKNIFSRSRPIEINLIEESGYSFPSGHSMISMAFYGLLIYLIYRYVKNKKLKYTLITLLSILIFLIGVSRIYLGVHYASDVIAGFCISLSYLMIYTNILKKWVLK